MKHLSLLMVMSIFLAQLPMNAFAETCLQIYENANKDGKFKSEIKLAREIEENFKDKSVDQITDAILNHLPASKLSQMNKFAVEYSKQYCKLKKSPMGKCGFNYEEILISLAILYNSNKFCSDGKPLSLSKLQTNQFLVPSNKNLVLNEFFSEEAKQNIQCREIHTNDYPEFGLTSDHLRDILNYFQHSKSYKGVENHGYEVAGKIFYIPAEVLKGSVLERASDLEKATDSKFEKSGGAVVLKKPDDIKTEKEFLAAFSQISEALNKNKQINCEGANAGAKILVDYFDLLPRICLPDSSTTSGPIKYFEEGVRESRAYDPTNPMKGVGMFLEKNGNISDKGESLLKSPSIRVLLNQMLEQKSVPSSVIRQLEKLKEKHPMDFESRIY